MKFTKLEATGNDFILVGSGEVSPPTEYNWAELARAMCQRRLGIGADGLIVVEGSKVADLKMRVFNPDGSEAEACGNGLRCFVKYVVERGLAGKSASHLTVETVAGVRKAEACLVGNRVTSVEVGMGMPRFKPEQIPATLAHPLPSKEEALPLLDYPLEVEGLPHARHQLAVSLLSLGNPHAVCFISEPVAEFPLDRVGPRVATHRIFPRGTNFEIVRVVDRGRVEARVWERGAGETLSCGSGACAIMVAGRLLDYLGNKVDIIYPGGTLTVTWDGKGEVMLAGPVEEVYTGEWLK